jgi:drug/metabolite transporter (DMT)-like permease
MSVTTVSRPATSRRTAAALLATSIVIGSFAFTLVKVVLRELSPLGLATGRVVVSAVVFVTVVARSGAYRQRILPEHRLRVVLCGLGGSAGFHILFSWGQQHASVAIAAVVMATFPVLVAVGEVVFLRHRLRRAQTLGLVLTTAGCVAIGLASTGGTSTLAGAIAIGLSTLTWAGVTVATRSITHRYDPWWLNTPGTVVGAVFMLAIDRSRLGDFWHLSPKGWLLVIWLGSASSAFIYFVMARVMTVFSATTASSAGTVVTPTSVMVAWVVLGDAPTWREVLGGVVVVAGVVLVTRAPSPTSELSVAVAA